MNGSTWPALLFLASTLTCAGCDEGDAPAEGAVTHSDDDSPSSGHDAGRTDEGPANPEASEDSGTSSDRPGAVPCPSVVDDLSESFAEAVCSKRGECCEDDYESCITEVTEALDAIYVDLSDAVASASASIHCPSFTECTDAILRADCTEWPTATGDLAEIPVDEPACREMVTPLLSAGDECRWNYECEEGFCFAEDGTCHEFARENEPCEDSLCSLPTMFCNGAGVCQRRLANGVTCSDPAECQSRVCDVEGSGMCAPPGHDACEYVPAAPATCSLRQGRPRSVPALVFALFALTAGFRRRTTWNVHHSS